MKIKFFILLIVLFSTSAVAGEPANDRCSAYSDKAFGICISAMNNACGTDNEKNAQACDNMENHFIDAAGEMPPWLVCPCWDEIDLLAVTAENISDFMNCEHYAFDYPNMAWIHAEEFSFGFSAFNSNSFFGAVSGCSAVTLDSYYHQDYITDEEANFCISQIATRCAELDRPIVP
jgi:hypothetical protein